MTTIQPKVSIIIPVYKTEKYLRQCLDSVINQSFDNFEVICVDDGSPDNSVNILKEYANRDSRITYISQPNKGLSAARNAGIMHSKGEYILPLDSDDFIDKDFLQILINAKEAHPNIDVITPAIILFFPKTGVYYYVLSPKPTPCNLSQFNYICCTSLFPRKLFDIYGGYDETLKKGAEDWDLWLRYILHGSKFMRMERAFFYYRQKDISESMAKQLLSDKAELDSIVKLLRERYCFMKKYNSLFFIYYKQLVRYTKRYFKYIYRREIYPIDRYYLYVLFNVFSLKRMF